VLVAICPKTLSSASSVSIVGAKISAPPLPQSKIAFPPLTPDVPHELYALTWYVYVSAQTKLALSS